MGKIFLINLLKVIIKAYINIKQITTGQGDYYRTSCVLDCPHFKWHFKNIAKDLSKHQALDTYPKAMQLIVSNASPDWAGDNVFFMLLKK